MCSTPLSLPTDHTGCEAALVDVVEQSFFAFAELCGPGDLAEEIEAEPQWLRAHMTFASEAQTGSLTLALPAPLAIELSAAFSGEEPAVLGRDMIADLTGELCNMVCGLWLTRACATERFRLQSPDVSDIERPAAGTQWRCARINGLPVLIDAISVPR